MVAAYRSAQRKSVIVEVQLALQALSVGVHGSEGVRRVERVVPERLEAAAAEAVRAALRHDVDGRAGIAPLLGAEIRGLDRHLLDEVDPDVIDHAAVGPRDRKSTRLNSSHGSISY